jgi:hypothetical protein
MIITRGFSLTNFLIGTSALGFQMFVLYPWHEMLREEFRALKAEHVSLITLLREDEKARQKELEGIKEQLALLSGHKRRS